jgi:catechol 2,3-dioxygenase-like lactoylglutathione lyase family enzyme
MRYYAAYFGFNPATARRFEDGTVIVQNADGFDLALHTVADPEPDPEFLHFGFRMESPEEVRLLQSRMTGDGLTILDVSDAPDLVSFKALDPDGPRVETYWEITVRR